MSRKRLFRIAVVAGCAVVPIGVVGFIYLAGARVADPEGRTAHGRLAAKLLDDDAPLGRAMIAIAHKVDARRERKARVTEAD